METFQVHNAKSIKMFEKMGFKEVGRSEVFGEVTLRATAADDLEVLLQIAKESSAERHYGQDDDDEKSTRRPPVRTDAPPLSAQAL